MKVKVECIPIELRVGDLLYKLEPFTAEGTPSNITSKITVPIQRFLSQAIDALTYIPAELSASGETKELTFVRRRTIYGRNVIRTDNSNLQKVLGPMPPIVRFRSRIHTALAQVSNNWKVQPRQLETVTAYGLATVAPHNAPVLTQAGKELLDSLRQLDEKRAPHLAYHLLYILVNVRGSLIDYQKPNCLTDLAVHYRFATVLFSGYYTGVRLQVRREGLDYIEKYAVKLVGMKGSRAIDLKLIDFLSLEMLPKYTASDDEKIRKRTIERIDELQKEA